MIDDIDDTEDSLTLEKLSSDSFREIQVKAFQDEVYALSATGLTLIESIAVYCTQRDMDPDEIKPYISQKLMADLTDEALRFNQLKKEARPTQLDFE